LTNSSVGSSRISDALGTTVCPRLRKCSMNRFLISWVCTVNPCWARYGTRLRLRRGAEVRGHRSATRPASSITAVRPGLANHPLGGAVLAVIDDVLEFPLPLLHTRPHFSTERADGIGEFAHRAPQLLGHARGGGLAGGLVDLSGQRNSGRYPGTEPEQAPHLRPPLPFRRKLLP